MYMIPRTLNKENDPAFLEKYGMRRLDDDSESDFETTDIKQNLDELYENQRNEMLKYFESENTKDDENIVSSKYYQYSALKNLTVGEPHIDSNATRIHICAFQINKSGKVPFLQYFMQKQCDQYIFPSFSPIEHIDAFLKAHVAVDLMNLCYGKEGYMEYLGYLFKNNEYYLFFNANDYHNNVHDLYRMNDLWLLTMDELVNTETVCGNFHVHSNVTQFFYDNPEFIYLQDENMENYEIPVIAYIGTTSKNANFISIFGESQSDCKSMFGPNYYFYDYQNAIKNSINKYSEQIKILKEKKKETELFTWLNKEKPLCGSVIRFALFLGRMKIIENSLNDKQDSSITTQELLKEDITCSSLKHRQIVNYLRISDRNGDWKNEYDSIFLRNDVALDDESVRCHGTTYVVKEYEQQLPLSCHFLDAKIIIEPWAIDKTYFIA